MQVVVNGRTQDMASLTANDQATARRLVHTLHGVAA
jgi:HPt (histidine-containing phosphotransfer) domain-containing protein